MATEKSVCTRCGQVVSDRTPPEGVTHRIGLTQTFTSWRLRFSRFRWRWLPEHADERVTGSYTELTLCDWCAGDVFLFAQGKPPRADRGCSDLWTTTTSNARRGLQ